MFLFKLTFLIITSSFLGIHAFQNQYCQLSCDFIVKSFQHTVCDREAQQCGPDPINCGPNFKMIQFNNADRQYILDIHNYLRNKVALGQEKRNNQPPAANMLTMTYNRELEFIAQCWANTCNGNPLKHDHCRRTASYYHVGQNLGFINSSLPQIDKVKSIKELILLWYNEVEIFDSDWVNETKDRGPNVKVGHYTQMMWANTLQVGCAAAYYTTNANGNNWHHLVFVCNYAPGGNYLGLPVYEIGKAASHCPPGYATNGQYKGLCGVSRTVNETIRDQLKGQDRKSVV